jgi:paraquat-inducible protein B
MSRKTNPTVIGAFTLGAVVLLVAAIVTFGSGRFFTRHTRAVAYFQGDIRGLSIGSAVDLRGVQVGKVTGIGIRLDLDTLNPLIPVYMEFDSNRFEVRGAAEMKSGAALQLAHEQLLKDAVEAGLHARLATQSLVTGQLVVELDLDRNEPRTIVGADPSTIEIPTSESDIQKLKNALGRIPLERIADAALRVLDRADRLISSPEIPPLLQSLTHASGSLDQLLTSLNTDLDPLVTNANQTLKSAQDALADAHSALVEMRTALTTANHVMATSVDEAAKEATVALQKADKVLADADNLIGPNSPQRYDIDQTLRSLSAASRALRLFADNLERRPNAIVMGK